MAKRKQRRRPEASMYEDEHFRADILPSPAGPTIEVYSKPHNKLIFKVNAEGMLFLCKSCGQEHLMSWESYSTWIQAPHLTNRDCPFSGKLIILRTLTPDEIELIARMKPLLCQDEM